MSPTRKQITPGPNQKCFCGSDLKYKKCCASRLPGSKRIGKDFPKLANSGDIEGALLAARADVTQYTIWHQSHTARGFFEGTPISNERIWHVDVEALCEYGERLLRAYRLAGRSTEMPAVLECLRINIQSQAWQHKIIFLQCLCALGEDWNVERGLREITKLGPIDKVRDPALLAMYLNLASNSISLADRLPLIDRVRRDTEDDSTRIHQGVVKATLLWVHNDRRGAAKAISEVIDYCEGLNDLDAYQRQKFGQALFFMGAIHLDNKTDGKVWNEYLERAVRQFKEALTNDNLSPSGRADAHRDLAGAFRVQEKWEDALHYYNEAIAANDHPILHVFKAECLNGLKRHKDAFDVIDAIVINSLEDDAEKADYVMKFAALAVEAGEANRLKTARSLFDLPLKREPIFHQQALRMKTVVLEAMANGKSPSLTKRAKDMLSALSSSIMLQPNFMGVGINLNKLIDENIAVKPAIRAHSVDDDIVE
jgi:tetratricopeptide (TPR) repeat protein